MTQAERIAPLENEHFWFVGRDRLFTEIIEGRVDADTATIVDLGCGTGTFAASLAGTGRLVAGIDAQLPPALPSGAPFVRASVEELPLRARTCDAVLARDVLEHVDDRRAMSECHRILRRGGCVILAVPAWPSLWSIRDERAQHLRRYRRRELRSLLEDTGFSVAEIRGYQFLLLPMLAVSRMWSRRSPDRQMRREERVGPVLNRVLTALSSLEVLAGRVRWLRPPTGSSYLVVGIRD